MSKSDDEIDLRSLAHKLRRAIRNGDIQPGMEEAAEVSAQMFLEAAEEEATSGTGMAMAGQGMAEILRALLGIDDEYPGGER